MAQLQVREATATTGARRDAPRRLLIGLAVAVVLAGLVVILLEARTSPGPRIASPEERPGMDDFWGVSNWPRVFEIGTLIGTVIMWALLIRASRRAGRWTPATVMMVATTALCWLDPIANWAPYVVYDSRILHFPESWQWANISPSAEPLMVWVGYSWFFILPAFLAMAIYQRLAARRPMSSFLNRHPLLSVLGIGWAICIPWDALVEMFLVRIGMYTYTQVVPWMSVFDGHHYQFPILIEATTFGFVLACAAPLMWRDDRGNTLCNRTADRITVLRARPNIGAALVGVAILSAVYIAYLGPYIAIRATGAATTVGTPFPYGTQKVYDPQQYYEKAGEPGPYYEGVWGGWEHRR